MTDLVRATVVADGMLAQHPPAPSVSADVYHLLDDAQEWSAFSRELPAQGGFWESSVVIEGMHCAACAITVEEALRAVPGVQTAEVSAASQRARVVWNAQQATPSAWMRAVQASGYGAVPANDAFASERRLHERRKALWRMSVAGFCMMQVMMYAWPAYIARPGDLTREMEHLLRWASWVLSLPVVLFSCGPFFSNALRDLTQRRISMDLPVALGMGMTFVVSSLGTFDPLGPFGTEVYFDSLTMFVFFLLTGRWLELRLRDRTAGALEALMNRLPDSVLRETAQGETERVAVRRLRAGDVVRVLPGEAFPADGSLLDFQTLVDEALLTGESRPVRRTQGEGVIAGSYNLGVSVRVRVEQVGTQTRFAQIVALMESASVQKPHLAQAADRIAKPFLLAVLATALAVGVLGWQHGPEHAVMVAVAILVVTCPCALSLATPVAMLAAAGALARSGVMVRKLQALESLAEVDTVVFDKTGTLTATTVGVHTIHTRAGVTPDQALGLAAMLACHSLHPASKGLYAAWKKSGGSPPNPEQAIEQVAFDIQEVLGQGVSGQCPDRSNPLAPAQWVRLGSAKFCGVEVGTADTLHACLSDANGWVATFELDEEVRSDAGLCVSALQRDGIHVHLLSGDQPQAVNHIAQRVGIASAVGSCTPEDKLDFLRRQQQLGHCVAMVGDGMNDGPVLAGAHVSFAVGMAVPLAQAQADFVILSDRLTGVVQTLRRARRSLRVVKQNLWWAGTYNVFCVPLAVVGWLPAWAAGLGMATSSLIVVLNALRLSRELETLE